MKYDIKILAKLLQNNSLKQFYYLIDDLLNDTSIQDPIFFNLVGIYFQKIKKEKKAIVYFNKSLLLNPKAYQVYNNRGVVHFVLKNIELAIDDFNQSLSLNPNIHDTYISLAKCYLELSHQNKVIEILCECKSKLKPNLDVLFLLGKTYYDSKRYEEAKNIFLETKNIFPSVPNIYNMLGLSFDALYDFDMAIQSYKEGLKFDSKNIDLLCNLGNLQRSLANFEDAKLLLNKAIEIAPYHATVHRYISVINKYHINDLHLIKMLKILETKYFKNNELQFHEMYFALSKAYEDIEDYERSVFYLLKGNKLRRQTVSQNNIDISRNHFDCIKKIFSNIDLTSYKNPSKAKPIFILGMPRSGTTLAEQIISSHPKVQSGGELTYVGDIIKKYFPSQDLDVFYKEVDKNLKELSSIMANDYLDLTKKISATKLVTDKLPQNFMFIGFIKIMFPDSKIIHCQRNPKATCMSIFKNYFPDNGIWYAYNAKELTEYYKLYEDMMSFWQNIYPNQIFNLQYEKLISEQKNNTEALLQFCELDWNDNCMTFHENKSPVRTLSTTQVRSSIYKSSVNKYELYQRLIPNFLENFND